MKGLRNQLRTVDVVDVAGVAEAGVACVGRLSTVPGNSGAVFAGTCARPPSAVSGVCQAALIGFVSLPSTVPNGAVEVAEGDTPSPTAGADRSRVSVRCTALSASCDVNASLEATGSTGFFLKKLNIGYFLESLHSMKSTFTALCLALCAAGPAFAQTPPATPAPAIPAIPEAPPGVRPSHFTLANGMQLIVQPDHRAPTAVHMVWVRVGSMDEVDGVTGVAHVLEHMMFKGTKKLAPGEFSRQVAALGGQENAFTSRDYTGFYQQIPAGKLADVMRLESDRFAHNQWPDDEFKRELEVVKEERRMRTDDQPRALLAEQLNAAALIASPARRPVVGWMSDLDSMTPDDARAFYRKWYVPANAVIVVAGDVEPKKVLALAQATYGAIPAKAVPARKPNVEPVQFGMRRIEVKAPAEQAYVALAFRSPALESVTEPSGQDRDALAMLVLSAVLSGYDGSRLDRGLTQGPARVADTASSSASVFGRGPAQFLLAGVPATGKTALDVESALRAEVAKVAKEGVSEAELARVKTQWIAGRVYARDSLQSQASELGSNWVEGLPLDAEDRLMALLAEVRPADVQRVAGQYFANDQLTVATLLPQPLAPGARARPDAGAGGAIR